MSELFASNAAGVLLIAHTLVSRPLRERLLRGLCDIVCDDEEDSVRLIAVVLLGKVTQLLSSPPPGTDGVALGDLTGSSSSSGGAAAATAPSSKPILHQSGGWVPHVSYRYVRAFADSVFTPPTSSSSASSGFTTSSATGPSSSPVPVTSSTAECVAAIEAMGYFLEVRFASLLCCA